MDANLNGGDPLTYKSKITPYIFLCIIFLFNIMFLEVANDNYQNQVNTNVSPLDDANTSNSNSFTTNTQQANSSASSNTANQSK
jgi:hypothetical protein